MDDMEYNGVYITLDKCQQGGRKMFHILNFIISLVLGAVAGWIAGQIMHVEGGWLKNMILGIVGGAVGGVILGLVGISGNGVIGNMIVSVIGACILIAVARKIG